MAINQISHEVLDRPDEVKIGTDRNFGFVFTIFCLVVGGFLLWSGNNKFWFWLAGAGVFALTALLTPRVLHPLNLLWFKFGMLLHHIITPIVLGLMFFVVFTPIGLLMRLTRKQSLSLKIDPEANTYWIYRKPPGPPPGSFHNQF